MKKKFPITVIVAQVVLVRTHLKRGCPGLQMQVQSTCTHMHVQLALAIETVNLLAFDERTCVRTKVAQRRRNHGVFEGEKNEHVMIFSLNTFI